MPPPLNPPIRCSALMKSDEIHPQTLVSLGQYTFDHYCYMYQYIHIYICRIDVRLISDRFLFPTWFNELCESIASSEHTGTLFPFTAVLLSQYWFVGTEMLAGSEITNKFIEILTELYTYITKLKFTLLGTGYQKLPYLCIKIWHHIPDSA